MRANAAEAEKAFSGEKMKDLKDFSEEAESDGLNRDEDGLFRGHRSTKSLGADEDLRRHRVSANDYISSKSNRNKGRYGVTVPKPFGFEIRDKVRPKSIR